MDRLDLKTLLSTFYFLFLLSSCAAIDQTENNQPNIYIGKDNILNYKGELTSESVQHAINLATSHYKKPTSLLIESTGGDVFAGLELGNWIYSNKMDVIVDIGCASSCANYVFTAGHKKYLSKKAVLIWHGGSYQESIKKLIANNDKFALKWRQKEDEFFKRIKVDSSLTVRGLKQYSLWDKLFSLITFQPIAGFDYSISDLGKFGIKNIILIDQEWSWRQYNNRFNVIRAKY